MQGMVALEALSYLLQLDGKNSIAYDYNKTDSNFEEFWKKNASVKTQCTYIIILYCCALEVSCPVENANRQ